MLINVWTSSGKPEEDHRPHARTMKKSRRASRRVSGFAHETMLSIPMLFFMATGTHTTSRQN